MNNRYVFNQWQKLENGNYSINQKYNDSVYKVILDFEQEKS